MSRTRLLVAATLVVAVLAFYAAEGHRYLSFESLKAHQAALDGWRAERPWQAGLAFFLGFVAFTAASLPGAALLSILAGAVFGFAWGLVISSFAAVLGSTVAFLASRFVLRDWLRARFGTQLRGIAEGVAREGAFHLFALRLVPGLPYFLINLAMGLTPMRVRTYYWVSQLGMLPSTALWVNAGVQLALLESLRDALDWPLLAGLAALGVFPLAARRAIEFARSRRTPGAGAAHP